MQVFPNQERKWLPTFSESKQATKHDNKLQAVAVSELIDFPFSMQTLMHYVPWQHLLKAATEAYEAFVLFTSRFLANNSSLQAFRIKNTLLENAFNKTFLFC